MSHKTAATVAHTIGIDTGKNTLHLIGLDDKGAIVLREKIARGRITARLANVPRCLIGIEAGMATHYVARELSALGHDVKQVPPAYAKPFRQGHKNDFRDAYAIAEAVQRPSTRCVPVKTDDQLDLQALHRVRSRLVGQRTAVINQIRGFLLEHGIAVRQGLRFLRQQLPDILARRSDVLSPRMIRIMGDLSSDWRRLDERIQHVTEEIEVLAHGSENCRQGRPAFWPSSLIFDMNGEAKTASTKHSSPDHSSSLGDSVTSSTRIRFSVHTPRRKSRSAVSISPATKSSGTPSIAAS